MAKEVNKQRRVKVPFSAEDTASLLQRNWPIIRIPSLTGMIWRPKLQPEFLMLESIKCCGDIWRMVTPWQIWMTMLNLWFDDDSDLESEREPLPRLNRETATEAAAFVKVIMASFKLGESSATSSVIQAPLTINTPSTIDKNESSSNTDIIFPVTVKRQTLPNTSSTRVVEGNGSVRSSTSIKKKREPWSEQEDLQLRDAVQRWGEGNWATMIKKDDFPIKRSTSQLSKRWSTLRKREGDFN
ncbi:uncharacterized protein LOC108337722 isoform X3 [Vigna angularis]|uniref:uncharacterized protein LOC108337722 isoform X3 n=1 Tax=Phaseolus angularis TaxID=3914 RepID=UPI0022B359B7|nr:uncharacterized protein LOC108337722 isoform X3 [Vigna angularis]